MHDDDDDIRRSGDSRRSRPFGSSRRPGEGLGDGLAGLVGGGLFDRVMRDVSSWFEDEDGRGTARRARTVDGDSDSDEGPASRRSPGHRSRRDARSRHDADADAVAGDVRDDGAPARQAGAVESDYDDEDHADSHRGRGPKGYRRSDERAAEIVNDAFLDADDLDARDVTVSVADGDVTLSGTVSTRRQKHRAENIAARMAGVHDVANHLRVERVEVSHAPRGQSGGAPGGSPDGTDDRDQPRR